MIDNIGKKNYTILIRWMPRHPYSGISKENCPVFVIRFSGQR